MTKTVSCPRCRHEFEVQTRAKIGEGTQRQLKSLNTNKINLLRVVLYSEEPLTVIDVQRELYSQGLARWSKDDTEEPRGLWNYHTIQADMSLLVGNDFMTMLPDSIVEYFDSVELRTKSKPVPTYEISSEQKRRVQEVIVAHDFRHRTVLRDDGTNFKVD